MGTDARISTSLAHHPKMKKLIRRTGHEGGLCFVWLILWAANNRTDGDLSGMTDEDIELAVDWTGEEGAFVQALVGVRLLDGESEAYLIHDWSDHNPWAAGARDRSLKAQWNAVKRHHGIAEADRQVPEYAAIRKGAESDTKHERSNADSTQEECTQDASSMLGALHDPESSNAPSPYPSPTPTPTSLTSVSATREASDPAELTPEAKLAVVLRKAGVEANSTNPAVVDFVRDGVTEAMLIEAVEIARTRKAVGERIPVRYLVPIIRDLLVPPERVPSDGKRSRGSPSGPRSTEPDFSKIDYNDGVGPDGRF